MEKKQKNKALLVTTQLPWPANSGGRLVTLQHLKYLAEHYTLDVVCKSETSLKKSEIEDIKNSLQLNELTVFFHWIKTSNHPLKALGAYLRSIFFVRPYKIEKHRNKTLERFVMQDVRNGRYTCIFFDQLPAVIPKVLRNVKDTAVVLFSHNVEWETVAARIPLTYNSFTRLVLKWEYFLLKRYEEHVLEKIKNVVFISDEDQRCFPGVKNSTTIASYASIFKPNTQLQKAACKHVVFIVASWTWSFNRSGLAWFLDKVAPLLNPQIEIQVAGLGLDQTFLKKYKHLENVSFLGFVQDLKILYNECSVVAIPLFGGSGIKIKALEALAHGIPTVATPYVTHGLENYQEAFYVAETASDFVTGIHELIYNVEFRKNMKKRVDLSYQKLYMSAWENELEDYLHTLQP